MKTVQRGCARSACVYVYVYVYLRFSFCFFIRFSRASVRGYIDERTAGLQSVFVNEPSAHDIICRLDVRCSTRMFTPGKKHRLLGNGERVKAKRGKNSIEQMAGGVKDGVETYVKKTRNLKKTIPRPPVCLWDFKMCTHAADIISVRPHQQAGPTRRAPRSLSHIIIWHRTPIICCA